MINTFLYKKENIILTIGNATEDMIRLKGLVTFVKASKHFSDFKFVIVGKYDKELKNYLKKINSKII